MPVLFIIFNKNRNFDSRSIFSRTTQFCFRFYEWKTKKKKKTTMKLSVTNLFVNEHSVIKKRFLSPNGH
jgi:hypothetical protein